MMVKTTRLNDELKQKSLEGSVCETAAQKLQQ